MDPAGLRRKDTTKGPPLRVLSLDGGGVRGFSMLILLQELMHLTYVEIQGNAPTRHQIPKPCDHFDLIVGTGTGGLIAIMLGRLRLDLETCKAVYERMTRRVFETDKTIAGIPYRSTLYKASKLEEAIRECVREHTVFENEGNDSPASAQPMSPMSPMTPVTPPNAYSAGPARSLSTTSRTSLGMSPVARGPTSAHYGNSNALLYDVRENRTKTAVTAVYKGTKDGSAALLRSYDSRKEPSPEFNCTIWQAGRATCATGLAFKPIQIGQSLFIDEGAGRYNPAPQALDEAVVNEWPGREVGVFVSIGTGKRPAATNNQQTLWWEGFVSSGMGDFAEARRRLVNKIEGCEETHHYMIREHLAMRGVNPESYFRFNVEVGVGDFGMNEWSRLTEISTNTRRYLRQPEAEAMTNSASTRLGRIHRAKARHERVTDRASWDVADDEWASRPLTQEPAADPLAAELPANEPSPPVLNHAPQYNIHYQRQASIGDKFAVISAADLASDEYPQPVDSLSPQPQPSPGRSGELNPPPSPYRVSAESQRPNASPPLTNNSNQPLLHSPPPLPPKTPLMYPEGHAPPLLPQRAPPAPAVPLGLPGQPPYPDTDGPPPTVNMARKPEYGVR